ncbi:NADAR family protein (plasmid) [Streptosporangium sp. NBC_01495]|uniref:NADAR family protein n=1 Tax=Streptosporangium sp. NBC_01495 TaxID=2903899 RepID=UPI002E33F55F|nr:NADAR family protein [Streptosporangium sp. NBC_01495]
MTFPASITRFSGVHAFLSNFAIIPVEIRSSDGTLVVYPTVEHAFNAAKTTDPHQRAWVLAAPTPRKAKLRGRQVTLRPGWDTHVRWQAMDIALRAKFTPGRDVTDRLLATGEAFLEEGNTWCDNEWGVCRCSRPRCLQERDRFEGNALGRMLMALRDIHAGRRDSAVPLLTSFSLPPR